MPNINNNKQHLLLDLGQFSQRVNRIYTEVILDYHIHGNLHQAYKQPYSVEQFEWLFYQKCWIDSIQWHIEDKIRDPKILPLTALTFKRRIDVLNQDRTNVVERIDDFLMTKFANVPLFPNATVNSESPAWALDRLSILALKIFHMEIETRRLDVSAKQKKQCEVKLEVLREQQNDLLKSINELLKDISEGFKYMKVYKQMKMYNDPNLNPVLYSNAKI